MTSKCKVTGPLMYVSFGAYSEEAHLPLLVFNVLSLLFLCLVIRICSLFSYYVGIDTFPIDMELIPYMFALANRDAC